MKIPISMFCPPFPELAADPAEADELLPLSPQPEPDAR